MSEADISIKLQSLAFMLYTIQGHESPGFVPPPCVPACGVLCCAMCSTETIPHSLLWAWLGMADVGNTALL